MSSDCRAICITENRPGRDAQELTRARRWLICRHAQSRRCGVGTTPALRPRNSVRNAGAGAAAGDGRTMSAGHFPTMTPESAPENVERVGRAPQRDRV